MEAEQMMKEADKDGDGTIDYEGERGRREPAARPAVLLTCPSAPRVRGHDDRRVLQAGPVGAAASAVGSCPSEEGCCPRRRPPCPPPAPSPATWPINAPARLACASLPPARRRRGSGEGKGFSWVGRGTQPVTSAVTPDSTHSPALGCLRPGRAEAGHPSPHSPAPGRLPKAPPGARSFRQRPLTYKFYSLSKNHGGLGLRGSLGAEGLLGWARGWG